MPWHPGGPGDKTCDFRQNLTILMSKIADFIDALINERSVLYIQDKVYQGTKVEKLRVLGIVCRGACIEKKAG